MNNKVVEQNGDEHMLWLPKVDMINGCRRMETCQTLIVATSIIVLLVVIVILTLYVRCDIFLHADPTACMVVVGNNGHHQHYDADEE